MDSVSGSAGADRGHAPCTSRGESSAFASRSASDIFARRLTGAPRRSDGGVAGTSGAEPRPAR